MKKIANRITNPKPMKKVKIVKKVTNQKKKKKKKKVRIV